MLSLLSTSAAWLLAGLTVLLAVVMRRRRSRLLTLAAQIPGPPTVPLLGNALSFADPGCMMTVLTDMLKEYGDVIRLWLGPELNVVVADPDDLKMLLSSTKNSVKGPSYKYMEEYIGGGILSGSGHPWRRHRKIASPNYGKRAIESYERVFNRETAALLQRLRTAVGQGTRQQIDVYSDVVKATSYSVCQTLMALSKEQTMTLPYLHNLINLTDKFYTNVFNRMTKWYYQLNLYYRFTSSYEFTKMFHKMSEAFGLAIVEHRKRSLKDIIAKQDFSLDPDEDTLKNTELGVIDRFILSNELDFKELVGETYTIFTSSQEASAKISSFMLLMLAYHPEYQDHLYSEISSVLGERDAEELTGADLKRMSYLDCVFKECVRLFPIGAIIQRTITEEFRIGKYTLPAGCSLIAPIYQMSRDPRYWQRPNDFYPDHFALQHVARRPANCFLPFSVGPMDCLGRYFGEKLIKTICASVVREFRLSSEQSYRDLRIKVAVSIASVNGFKMHLHPRTNPL